MTDSPAWMPEASRRVEAGERVLDVARDLGVDDRHLRIKLNINGAADKLKARTRVRKSDPERRAQEREMQSGARAYADPKPPRPLTLPKISLPDLDEPRLIRIAPRSVASVDPGVERIRAIHLGMIRRGLIAEPSDLIHRLSH